MSFHKLKIGSRKKDQAKGTLASCDKIKKEELLQNLNQENKFHSRKASFISMSDDFNNQILGIKKNQLHSGPKTDRVHRIEKMDFTTSNPSGKKSLNEKGYFFNYSNSEQNKQYSATQLIDFLNFRSQNKASEQFSSRSVKTPVLNISDSNFNDSKQEAHERQASQVRNVPHTKQISQVKLTGQNEQISQKKQINSQQQQLTKSVQVQISKKRQVIKPEEQPLNYQLANQQKAITQKSNIKANQDSTSKNDSSLQMLPEQNEKKIRNIQRPSQVQAIDVNRTIQQRQGIKIQTQKIQLSIIKSQQSPNHQIPSIAVNQSIIKEAKQTSQASKVNNSQSPVKKTQSPAINPYKSSSPAVKKHNESPKIESQKGSPSVEKQTLSSQQSILVSPVKGKLSYKPINQIELTILQQNKSLTQEVQKLRKQRDELLFTNKRLQVQLLQTNRQQYYQKQILRLRQQVQNLQSSQEQFRHNSFVLLNKNKELQSTQDLDKKQLKKLSKELELIKIQSTKEKYELKQKSASLQNITKQLEERNFDLSNKFEEYYKKFHEVQKNFKIKCQQQSNLRKMCQILQSKVSNNEKSSSQKLKHYQNQLHRFSLENNELSNSYRNFQRQSGSQIQNLRQNIKQLNLKRQSQSLLMQSRTKTLQKHNNTIQAELQVVRLQETVKQLQTEVQKRSILIRQLNTKINGMISMSDYEDMRKQLESVCESKLGLTQEYQREVLSLNIQIEELRNKVKEMNKKIDQNQNDLKQRDNVGSNTNKKTSGTSNSGKMDSLSQKQNFKQILRQQIQQCDSAKQEVFNKSQALFQSKQQTQELKIKYESLKNQLQIMKRQFSSYENNSKVKKQILEQQLINQIESMKRKLTVLEKKYESKIKQNKEKESFIVNFIVGKSNSNDAQYLTKQLERVFLQKQKLSLH